MTGQRLRVDAEPARPDTDAAEDVLASAVRLRQQVYDEADRTAERGGYSAELHRAFTEAGFYRILQPRRFGGLELDLATFLRVIIEIGRGDPATAWCLCLASGHVMHVASFYSERAQQELLGSGHFCSPHRALPTGTARPADGGYVVNGRWDYCSGVTHSTHLMVNAQAVAADGEPDGPVLVCVVPRDEITVLDDWGGDATIGLAGSGSNTVELHDVFVPAHLAEPFTWKDHDIPTGGTVGYLLHGNPMYLGRTLTYFIAELVAPMVGAAFAALDEYETLLHSRPTSFPPRIPRTESPFYLQWYGQAIGCADAAEALLLAAAERYAEAGRRWARCGEPFSVAHDARIRELAQHAGMLAWQAVDLIFATGGTSAAKRGSRLQRYYRDVSMYRTHIGSQYQVYADSLARLRLGGPLVM